MTMKLDGDFKAPVAVVDWVSFKVELKNRSHGGYLKNTYSKFNVSHADPLNKGDGGAASIFEIRVQHPDNYSLIDDLLSELEQSYGLASEPKLAGIEVSIDFYHQSANLNALKAMTEKLMRGIAPPKNDNPRLIGESGNDGVLPNRKKLDVNKTLYIGNKQDDLMWRVYLKRTDDVFIDDGKREPKPIPASEYRARVEVCVQGIALENIGLKKLNDLRDFHYERLYSEKLFRFAKRDIDAEPLSSNPVVNLAFKSLGVTDESPACVLNKFGRKDSRFRERILSKHLTVDTALGEVSRQALRRLTARF